MYLASLSIGFASYITPDTSFLLMAKMKKLFTLFLLYFVQTVIGSIPQYYCTGASDIFFEDLTNLIGSIHRHNYENLKEIAVFDLGLKPEQREILNTISKVQVYSLQDQNPNLLKYFNIPSERGIYLGWYAWKPVAIKEALEKFPYALWIDAGCIVMHPLDDLFSYIQREGYFLNTIGDEGIKELTYPIKWGTTSYVKTKFELDKPKNAWILDKEFVMGGFVGVSKEKEELFLKDWYELTKDIQSFADDGTAPGGWGAGRHDQTLLSILAYSKGLKVHRLDHTENTPINIGDKNKSIPFFINWDKSRLAQKRTCVLVQARKIQYAENLKALRYKQVKFQPNQLNTGQN
jgi:hypothetical protein